MLNRMKSLLLLLVLVTLASCSSESELILIYIISYVKQNEVFVTPSGSGDSVVLCQGSRQNHPSSWIRSSATFQTVLRILTGGRNKQTLLLVEIYIK